MVVVAVPGGLGGFGRLIVDALLATGKHEVYVLTRKPPSDVPTRLNPAGRPYSPVLTTDYKDVASLTALLDAHGVHTVICALGVDFADVSAAQVRLIEAAAASKTVKRFAPSEFNIDYDLPDDLLPYPQKHFHVAARRAVEATHLEYTYFYLGVFMDYFALPKLDTHLRPIYVVLDLAHHVAAIPGDGAQVLATILTTDAARYIAASLDLASWPRALTLVASQPTLNELVLMAEAALGAPLTRRYQAVASLLDHSAELLPGNRLVAAEFDGGEAQLRALQCDLNAAMALGAYDLAKAAGAVDLVALLGGREGEPVRVEEWLQRHWGPQARQEGE